MATTEEAPERRAPGRRTATATATQAEGLPRPPAPDRPERAMTPPMPKVTDQPLKIRHVEDISVVTLPTDLPTPVPQPLLSALCEVASTSLVAVDLSDVTLTEPAATIAVTGALLVARRADDGACLICERLSGRTLLRQWGVGSTIAVFASLGDALQARRLAGEGYGSGWRLASDDDQMTNE